MPIDFFEKEVEKIQQKFNQTYGQMIVCNIRARQRAMFTIIHLIFLCRKITGTKSKGQVRKEIQKFIRIRDTLNNHFIIIEKHLNERRQHGNSDGHQGRTNDGTGNGKRVSNHLQEMR